MDGVNVYSTTLAVCVIAAENAVGHRRIAILEQHSGAALCAIACEDTVGHGRTATDADYPVPGECGGGTDRFTVPDSEAAQDGGSGLASGEIETAPTHLAVNDAQGGIVAFRADGDGLALKVDGRI